MEKTRKTLPILIFAVILALTLIGTFGGMSGGYAQSAYAEENAESATGGCDGIHKANDGWDGLNNNNFYGKVLSSDNAKRYLTEDITLTEAESFNVRANGVTLCLNGHKIVGKMMVGSSAGHRGGIIIVDCDGSHGEHKYDVNTVTVGGKEYRAGYTFSDSGANVLKGGLITNPYGGAGIEVFGEAGDKSVTIKGGTVAGCTRTPAAYTGGGAVVIHNGASLQMEGGAISGNSNLSTFGAGVCLESASTFTMKGGKISENYAKAEGAGIHALDFIGSLKNKITISGGTISKNVAGADGGGIALVGSELTQNGGTITGNVAAGAGGVYATTGSKYTLNNGTVSDNTAVMTSGGGIGVVYNGATVIQNGGNVIGNSAAEYGGGIYVTAMRSDTGVQLQVSGGTISDNTAAAGGGIGIGAVTDPEIKSTEVAVEIKNIAITKNKAIGSEKIAAYGGGIFGSGFKMDLKLTDCDVNGNTASTGGGIAAYDQKSFVLESTKVQNNVGGGVLLASATTKVVVAGNTQVNGNLDQAEGDALDMVLQANSPDCRIAFDSEKPFTGALKAALKSSASYHNTGVITTGYGDTHTGTIESCYNMFKVAKNDSGELEIEEKPALTLDLTSQTRTYGSVTAFELKGTNATLSGFTIKYLIDGVYGAALPTDAGTYTVKITRPADSGNTGYVDYEKTANLIVNPREITVTPTSGQSKTYGTADSALKFTATGLVNGDTANVFTGALARAAGTDAGSYDILIGTLSAGGNYTITFTDNVKYQINPYAITIQIENKTSFYGESISALTWKAADGFSLQNGDTAESMNIVLAKADGTNAGTYTISGTYSGGNYTVTFENGTYTITKATLTVAPDSDQSKIYGASDPTLTYTATGLVGSDTLTGALSRASGENVGSYDILIGTLSAGNNYTITFADSVEFQINSYAITIDIENKTSVYGESISALTWKIADGFSLQNGDTTESMNIVLAKADGENAGTYAVTGTYDNNNYTVTFTDGTYAIAKAQISGVTVEGFNGAYDGSAHSVSVKGAASGDIVMYATSKDGYYYSVAPKYLVGDNTVYVRVFRNDNYEVLELTGKVEIARQAEPESSFILSGTVFDKNGDKVPAAYLTVKIGGKVVAVGATSSDGTYSITGLANGLYSVEVTFSSTDGKSGTATAAVLINGANLSVDFTLPELNLNGIIEVETELDNVAADGIDKVLKDSDIVTDADKKLALDNGGNVTVKLTIGKNGTVSGADEAKKFSKRYNVFSVLDINMLKSVTDKNGKILSSDRISSVNDLIRVVVSLDENARGKKNYTIVREHGGAYSLITSAANEFGEYVELSADGQSLTLYVRNFSTYILSYQTGLSGGAIAGITVGSVALLLLLLYVAGYFFLYRRHKLEDRAICVIYAFLPEGSKKAQQVETVTQDNADDPTAKK